MFFLFLIFHISTSAKRFSIFKYIIYLSVIKLDNSFTLYIDFINVELDDDIVTFVFSNCLRLSFTILFKFSFESMSDHSLSLILIMKNETFFSSVTKSFFVRTIISIELIFLYIMNEIVMKFFSEFSTKLIFCHKSFLFILDEIKDLFEIF